jgi:hypothetical protein
MDDLSALEAELKARPDLTAPRFLRSELEVAATLGHTCGTSSERETGLRNLRNAWRALKTARRMCQEASFKT